LDINPEHHLGLTVFRLPRSHWHCRLSNFAWAQVRPPRLQEYVLAFLHGVQDGRASHLLLTGGPGIGKTHLGVGLYRVAAATWGTELVTWLSIPAFVERVKRSYDQSVLDPWYDVEAARRLVVLDDLFGKELTSYEKDQILTRLFDTAYTNGAAVLATMNPDVKELAARLPPHEISRLLAESTIIPMSADKDWRLK
jgi:DNA replication protein DnaC